MSEEKPLTRSQIVVTIFILFAFVVSAYVGWSLNDLYEVSNSPNKFFMTEERLEYIADLAFNKQCAIVPANNWAEQVNVNCEGFRDGRVDNFEEWCERIGGIAYFPDWCEIEINEAKAKETITEQTDSGGSGGPVKISEGMLDLYKKRNANLAKNPEVLSTIQNASEGFLCGAWMGIDTYRKWEPNHQSTDICLGCGETETTYIKFLEKLIKNYCPKELKANCRIIDAGYAFETEMQSCEELK